jgi:hypothetical protein
LANCKTIRPLCQAVIAEDTLEREEFGSGAGLKNFAKSASFSQDCHRRRQVRADTLAACSSTRRRERAMKDYASIIIGVAISLLVAVPIVSAAQSKEDQEFMKKNSQEMRLFMEKCSKCHGLQRVLERKRSPEEWDKVVKIMSGKPHADLTNSDLQKIEKWIDFFQTAVTP